MSEIYKGWTDGIPPRDWVRIMAFDVGGATANNLEWAAICPETQSLVYYDEVNIITTNMREVAELSLPKMKPDGSSEEYNFLAKVGDYENRVALDDMRRHGIAFTNAVKHSKTVSVHRLSGYLHPNPKRPYPSWHPLTGQLGAPLAFITAHCPQLIAEIPQQKWKKAEGQKGGGDSMKDELDRSVRHDAVDCALYIARILPAPATIPIPKIKLAKDERSLQSQLYWADVARAKAQQSATAPRKAYNPSHSSGGVDLCKSLLGFSL